MTSILGELKILYNGNLAKSKITKNINFSKSGKKIPGFSKNTPENVLKKMCAKFNEARTTRNDLNFGGTEITEHWKFG